VQPESKELREGPQDQQVQLEQPASQVQLDLLEQPALVQLAWEPQEPQEQLEQLVQLAWEPQEQLDLRVLQEAHKVHVDHKDHRDHKDSLVQLV
jgi:hypothetical protein